MYYLVWASELQEWGFGAEFCKNYVLLGGEMTTTQWHQYLLICPPIHKIMILPVRQRERIRHPSGTMTCKWLEVPIEPSHSDKVWLLSSKWLRNSHPHWNDLCTCIYSMKKHLKTNKLMITLNLGTQENSSERRKHILLEFSSAFHIVRSKRYLVCLVFLFYVVHQSTVNSKFEQGEVHIDTGSTTRKDRVVPYFSQTLLDRHCMNSWLCFLD